MSYEVLQYTKEEDLTRSRT